MRIAKEIFSEEKKKRKFWYPVSKREGRLGERGRVPASFRKYTG